MTRRLAAGIRHDFQRLGYEFRQRTDSTTCSLRLDRICSDNALCTMPVLAGQYRSLLFRGLDGVRELGTGELQNCSRSARRAASTVPAPELVERCSASAVGPACRAAGSIRTI